MNFKEKQKFSVLYAINKKFMEFLRLNQKKEMFVFNNLKIWQFFMVNHQTMEEGINQKFVACLSKLDF
jgi:hypothetical protein